MSAIDQKTGRSVNWKPILNLDEVKLLIPSKTMTVLWSIDESLRKLGTDYIGLLLIHSPRPFAEMFEPTGKTWNEENVQVCKAMEDTMKSGKVRAIGLCNFQIEDIGNILANSDVKPAMNQVLVNITHYPEKLIQYCQEHGIVVGAYSPNATGNLKGEQIEAIAKKYGCSIPQIGSRFDVQLGCVVLPKSTNPAHIKENGELDFVISDEDMEILKQIGKYEGWKGAEDKLVKR